MTTENPDVRKLFEFLPGNYLILKPDSPKFTIVDASDAYLAATNTQREHIVGKSLFDVFPDNPNDPTATGAKNILTSMNLVLANKSRDIMETIKYDIPVPGSKTGEFEERYWSPMNYPLLDASGNVTYIINLVTDVTAKVKLSHSRDDLRMLAEEVNSGLANQLKELETSESLN